MPLNVATQVAGMMLHYATIEKFVAVLQGALPKVEVICTSHNDRSSKNVARNVGGRVCYSGQFFVRLVTQQNCKTSRRKNWLV